MLPFTLDAAFTPTCLDRYTVGDIGMVMASAFPAIVVYAQELLPGRVGMISGMFFGLSFGWAALARRYWGAGRCHLHRLRLQGLRFSARDRIAHRVPAQFQGGEEMSLEDVARRYAVACRPPCCAVDPADPHDPSRASFFPAWKMLNTLPQELADPIGDDAHSPVPGIVHRHPDRVLFKVVSACPVYCRFCFSPRDHRARKKKAGCQRWISKRAGPISRARRNLGVILTAADPLYSQPAAPSRNHQPARAIPHGQVIVGTAVSR